ncbi:MAG: murein L,D-transpeptidase catalytic domain family protein [Pseudomonas sp.]
MLNALRRVGALSVCCLSLLAGPVAAIETSFATPYTSSVQSSLISRLAAEAPDLSPQVLLSAVSAMQCAIAGGVEPADRLAVIDFSLPSSEQRLWIFDLASQKLMLRDLVAHGQGSGDNFARTFSNIEGSHQSSIGLFRTQESYFGQHGYSLRMDGLEPGFNDLARQRAIVIHPADYVDPDWIQQHGRIGRSHGCPAVRPEVASMVVDSLKGGQFMFSWYPDDHWLATSALINCPHQAEDSLMTAGR